MADSANLGPELETYVTDLVRTGRYHSRMDVLREGVRLVEEQEKHLLPLDAAINRGLEDAAAERVKPLQDVAVRLGAKYRKMSEDRGA